MSKKDVEETRVDLKVTAMQNGNGGISRLRLGFYVLVTVVAVVGYVYATNGTQDREITENKVQLQEVSRRLDNIDTLLKDVDTQLDTVQQDLVAIKVAVGADKKDALLQLLEQLLILKKDKE